MDEAERIERSMMLAVVKGLLKVFECMDAWQMQVFLLGCTRQTRANLASALAVIEANETGGRCLTKNEQEQFASWIAESQRMSNDAMRRIRDSGESIDLSDASPS